MITHLMMDVDGVLVTGRPSDGLPWQTDLEDDLGISPKQLHDVFFDPYWPEIVVGRRGLRETLEKVLSDTAPHLSASQLIDYWFSNDVRLDMSVLSSLQTLSDQGISVFLATNQDALRARYLWDDLGLKAYADDILSSSRLAVAKPDPMFFERVVDLTGAPLKEHLLIDDSQTNVSAAKNAGWQAFLWTGEETLEHVVQLFVIG